MIKVIQQFIGIALVAITCAIALIYIDAFADGYQDNIFECSKTPTKLSHSTGLHAVYKLGCEAAQPIEVEK